jgi:Zn ribbon nucleic-acid-binding protein
MVNKCPICGVALWQCSCQNVPMDECPKCGHKKSDHRPIPHSYGQLKCTLCSCILPDDEAVIV